MTTASLLLLFALSPLADPAEDAKTLATIRTATRENFTSIHSLQVSYRYFEWDTEQGVSHWDWTISGEKFLVLTRGPQKPFPKLPEFRLQLSYDGTKFYQIDFDPDDPTQIRSILRSSKVGDYYYGSVPLDLLGWRLPGVDQTFLGLLDAPAARLLGREDVEGNPCWKVDLGVVTFKGNPTNRLTAWFDPAVGYWLRRLKSRPDIVPPVLAPGQVPFDNIAMEFDQFEDLSLGGERWFPTKYKKIGAQKTLGVIFEAIKINPVIPDELFTPEIPIGMLVTDEPGTPDQITTYAGGDAGYEAYKKKALAEAAELSQAGPGNPLIDARSDGRFRWTTVLMAVSLVIVLVGCGLWWKSRART